MEALTELCDLVAENPEIFADKISWICSRCPPPSSPRLTRSHLHALLALSRFLSKSPKSSSSSRSPILDFLRLIPSPAFRSSFWPDSSSSASFFAELLRYLSAACNISTDLSAEISPVLGAALVSAAAARNADPSLSVSIARSFLSAASHACPPVLPVDADRLVASLLDDDSAEAPSTSESVSSSAATDAFSNSDAKAKGKEEEGDEATSGVREEGSASRSSSADRSENGSSSAGTAGAAGFEEESVEELERQEIAFRLVGQLLDRAGGEKVGDLEQVREVATKQLKSLPAFLKVQCC